MRASRAGRSIHSFPASPSHSLALRLAKAAPASLPRHPRPLRQHCRPAMAVAKSCLRASVSFRPSAPAYGSRPSCSSSKSRAAATVLPSLQRAQRHWTCSQTSAVFSCFQHLRQGRRWRISLRRCFPPSWLAPAEAVVPGSLSHGKLAANPILALRPASSSLSGSERATMLRQDKKRISLDLPAYGASIPV